MHSESMSVQTRVLIGEYKQMFVAEFLSGVSET